MSLGKYGLDIGMRVRTTLRYTAAIGVTGIVQSYDRETGRVRIAWSDGVRSSEQPWYIERLHVGIDGPLT